MQPDFATLKPVQSTGQPDFSTLKPVNSPAQPPAQLGLFSRIGTDLTSRGTDIVSALANTNKNIDVARSAAGQLNPDTFGSAVGGVAHGVIQTIGGVLGGATDVVGELFKSAIGKLQESPQFLKDTLSTLPGAASLIPVIDKVGGPILKAVSSKLSDFIQSDRGQAAIHAAHQSAIGQTVEGVYNAWQKLKENDPDAAKTLSAIGNIINAGLMADAAKPVVEAIPGIAKEVAATGKEVVAGGKAFLEARAAASAAKDAASVDRLVGTITQGNLQDIPAAKAALSSVDATGVQTYQDLEGVLDNKIKTISNKLDQALTTKNGLNQAPELNRAITVGGETINHNYVEDAIGQLKQYYQATNDVEGAAKMDQLLAKAQGDGLTVKEVNDLAKLHGRDLNGFNVNGELASGLKKQAAENTRMGLKATARQLFDNPAYKAADEQISNLIKTRDLVSDMAEKVNALQQKIVEPTLRQKLANLGAKAVDLVNKMSLGSVKELLSFAGRNVGGDVSKLDALGLQKVLQRNLTALQDALSANATPEDIVKDLDAIINQNAPAEITSSVKSSPKTTKSP